jgi:hypothetical protein
MIYVLAVIWIVCGLAVVGALSQIATVLHRLVDLVGARDQRAAEQYAYAVSERAADVSRANALTKAQVDMAVAQQEVAQQQASALADQAAYRDEKRQHMASCAKRYEALLAGEYEPCGTSVKH